MEKKSFLKDSFDFTMEDEHTNCTVESVDEKFLICFDGEYFCTLTKPKTLKFIQVEGKPVPEHI